MPELDTIIVGEIMVPLEKYPHIYDTATLKEAIKVIKDAELEVNGIRSLARMVLVFDSQNRLEGLLRRRDIMKGLEPEFLRMKPIQYRKKLFGIRMDPNLAVLSQPNLKERIKERSMTKVSEVIRPIVQTVNYGDNLLKVIYEMVDNNISLLPVMDKDRVVGVARSVDAFSELVKLLEE